MQHRPERLQHGGWRAGRVTVVVDVVTEQDERVPAAGAATRCGGSRGASLLLVAGANVASYQQAHDWVTACPLGSRRHGARSSRPWAWASDEPEGRGRGERKADKSPQRHPLRMSPSGLDPHQTSSAQIG